MLFAVRISESLEKKSSYLHLSPSGLLQLAPMRTKLLIKCGHHWAVFLELALRRNRSSQAKLGGSALARTLVWALHDDMDTFQLLFKIHSNLA